MKIAAPRFASLLLSAASLAVLSQRPATQTAAQPTSPKRDVVQELSLAPGVRYRHLQQTSPDQQPWSVHVLEVHQTAQSAEIRAMAGHDEEGSMCRELPTAMARRAMAAGERVVGVVNGDFDLGGSYLGIPDGLTVASGEIWTTGRAERPAMALLQSGSAVIGLPAVSIELWAGQKRWRIGALNKPFGPLFGPQPRLYTRQFRPRLQSAQPFRAAVIGQLSEQLPLRADVIVRGRVETVIPQTTDLEIPGQVLILAETVDREPGSRPITTLRRGERVQISLRVRVAGKPGVREAIGGFPILVRNGQAKIAGEPSAYLRLRHPRTAVCYGGASVFFAVVDGRQPELSVGMTLEELAGLMVSLGCEAAMNTDGGGSSVMAIVPPAVELSAATICTSRLPLATGIDVRWPFRMALLSCNFQSEVSNDKARAARLQIVNSPSDGAERGRGNAWLIVTKPQE